MYTTASSANIPTPVINTLLLCPRLLRGFGRTSGQRSRGKSRALRDSAPSLSAAGPRSQQWDPTSKWDFHRIFRDLSVLLCDDTNIVKM